MLSIDAVNIGDTSMKRTSNKKLIIILIWFKKCLNKTSYIGEDQVVCLHDP